MYSSHLTNWVYFFSVAIHALSEICKEDECPTGLILQAAFNTLYDEIHNHPMLKVKAIKISLEFIE